MNTLLIPLEPLARALVEAMLNSLVPGLLLTALAGLALRQARRLNAATRFVIWWATLLAVVVLPLALLARSQAKTRATSGVLLGVAAISSQLGEPAPVVDPITTTVMRVEPVAVLSVPVENPASPLPAAASPLETVPASAPFRHAVERATALHANNDIKTPASAPLLSLSSKTWVMTLFLAWAAMSSLLLARLLIAGSHLARLKCNAGNVSPEQSARFAEVATALLPGRAVEVGISDLISMPVAAGLARPMVLFPASLAGELTLEEFTQIARHELAHLARLDDWTHFAQHLLLALFCFHPAAWWIAARLELEREIACDDHVVAGLPEAKGYALCLTRLAELRAGAGRFVLAPGAWRGESQLARRVQSLLDRRRNASPRLARSGAVFAGIGAVMVVIALARLEPLIGIAAAAEKAATAETKANSGDQAPANPLVVKGEPEEKVAPPPPPRAPKVFRPNRGQEAGLLREEMALVERQLKARETAVERGGGSPDEVMKFKRDLLRLRQELATLGESGDAAGPSDNDHLERTAAQQAKLAEQLRAIQDLQTTMGERQMAIAKLEQRLREGEVSGEKERTDLMAELRKQKRDFEALNRQGAELQRSAQSIVHASGAPRDQRIDLLREEMGLVEGQLREKRKQAELGVISPADVIPTERELLSLRRQLVILEAEAKGENDPGQKPGVRGRITESTAATKESVPFLIKQRELLLEEFKLGQEQLARKALSLDEASRLRRETLALKRQIAEVEERLRLAGGEFNAEEIDARAREMADKEKRTQEERQALEQRKQKQSNDEREQALAAARKEQLASLLEIVRTDPDPSVRATALGSLQSFGVEGILEPLSVVILNDRDKGVRNQAIGMLVFASSATNGTATILKLYDAVDETDLKERILQQLTHSVQVQLPNNTYTHSGRVSVLPSAVAKLMAIAKEGVESRLRIAAVQQLWNVADDSGADALISLYDVIKETDVRTALVNGLCARPGASAQDKVMAIAKNDSDPAIRRLAVQRLARVELPPAPAAPAPRSP